MTFGHPFDPAAMLAKALASYDFAQLRALAEQVGVTYDVVLRASGGAKGRPTRANDYFKPLVHGAMPVDVSREITRNTSEQTEGRLMVV